MPTSSPRWIRQRRPITGRLKLLSAILAGLVLIVMARQIVLDGVYAFGQYRSQARIDRDLANAPARPVHVKVIFEGSHPPDSAGGNTTIEGLPNPCPGVGPNFNMPSIIPKWCLYAFVDPSALQRGFKACPEGPQGGDICSEGTVMLREANGRMSLGDRTGATSYFFLVIKILLAEIFALLELVPIALVSLIVPFIVLDLIYGRRSTRPAASR